MPHQLLPCFWAMFSLPRPLTLVFVLLSQDVPRDSFYSAPVNPRMGVVEIEAFLVSVLAGEKRYALVILGLKGHPDRLMDAGEYHFASWHV